jgi:hypothetical protein
VPAVQRMQHEDAYMNPLTHQLQQNIYMASYNSYPKQPDDIFRILGRLRPDEVEGQGQRAAMQAGVLRRHAQLRTLTVYFTL